MAETIHPVSITQETRRRYLNYALSVITSRALPDVRDGLKPVQRRILYTMFTDLHLTPEARYTKCARVVGDVMGKYHPHGDTAIYDALVRMAQDFSLRYPLVDDPSLESKDLLKFIKGPDFPTGGLLLAGKRELKEIYESGSGMLKLRGEWKIEEPKGRKQNPTLVVTSIPYGPTKQSIVEK